MSRLLTIEDLGPSVFKREGLTVSSTTIVGVNWKYGDDAVRKGPYFLKQYDEVFPDPLHYNAPMSKFLERVTAYVNHHGFWLMDFSPEDIQQLQKEDMSVVVLYREVEDGFSEQMVFKDTTQGILSVAHVMVNMPSLKLSRAKICLSEGKIVYTEEEGETK